MKDERQNSGGTGCFIMGVIGLFLPVLYVLSVGPANFIAIHHPSTQAGLHAVYFPLGLLTEYFPHVAPVLEWYVDLWS